jgi:hypothetical protein
MRTFDLFVEILFLGGNGIGIETNQNLFPAVFPIIQVCNINLQQSLPTFLYHPMNYPDL